MLVVVVVVAAVLAGPVVDVVVVVGDGRLSRWGEPGYQPSPVPTGAAAWDTAAASLRFRRGADRPGTFQMP